MFSWIELIFKLYVLKNEQVRKTLDDMVRKGRGGCKTYDFGILSGQ